MIHHKYGMMRLLWSLILMISFFLHENANAALLDEADVEFPAPLKADEFNSTAGLQIIEFFSPYCSHCKVLAPIWKDTWATFHEEGKKLKISLSQVDCAESGDLCQKERITAFPDIRLYGQNGFIRKFPQNVARTKENLIEFAREAANEPFNAGDDSIVSVSELITGGKFADLLAGKSKQPYLLSFWPAKNARNNNGNILFENCDECNDFQRTWRILSVKLAALNISTGHLNCESSATVCNKLGFNNLVQLNNHRADRSPKVALVLPGKSTNNLFIYDGPFSTSLSVFEDFAKRTYFNSRVMPISTEDILEIVQKDFRIYQSTEGKSPAQKVHIIFSYNAETVVAEDIHFLQNLIEPLSRIPNAYLYKSEEDLDIAVTKTFDQMYEMINYNTSEPEKIPRQEYIDFNVMPGNPNIYLFRDGDKIPHIYPGFSTTELRKIELIVDWIKEFSQPVVNQITAGKFDSFLQSDSPSYEGLAIVLVDTADSESTDKSNVYLRNLIVGEYDYEHVRMGSMVEDVANKRISRLEKANALKEKGSKTSVILEAARKEIFHEDNKKVEIGYLDISKSSNLLKQMDFKDDNRENYIGRVIFIDKNSKTYYKEDPFGNDLIANPFNVRETFINVLLPQKSTTTHRVNSRLLYSPYGQSLRMLDYIHRYGFWGYASFVVLIFGCLGGIKIYKRRRIGKRYRGKRNVTGLLGRNKSKSKD